MNRKFLLGLTGLMFLTTSVSAHAFYNTTAKHALLMDAETGTVLFEKDADVSMPPASMSKLMTIYVLFENIKNKKVSLEDEFVVSENAWRKGGVSSGSSTMFLNPGEKVKVQDLIKGIIIQSGNDACIVVAENLAGSEEAFAHIMQEKANEIGLKNSTFKNSTGLPDPEHKMSSKDLAKLAYVLIKEFPEYYPIFSEETFTYNGITQRNRNPLLGKVLGADGLKTGHTKEAGFGLTASVKTVDGRRLILVLNGLKSMRERDVESRKMVMYGMNGFENTKLVSIGQEIDTIPVWLGEKDAVKAVSSSTFQVTNPRGKNLPTAKITYESPLQTPIKKGDKIGKIIFEFEEKTHTVDLLAQEDVKKSGYFRKLKQIISSWFNL